MKLEIVGKPLKPFAGSEGVKFKENHVRRLTLLVHNCDE